MFSNVSDSISPQYVLRFNNLSSESSIQCTEGLEILGDYYILIGFSNGLVSCAQLKSRRVLTQLNNTCNTAVISIATNKRIDEVNGDISGMHSICVYIFNKGGLLNCYKLSYNVTNYPKHPNIKLMFEDKPLWSFKTNSFGFFPCKSIGSYLLLPNTESSGIQLLDCENKNIVAKLDNSNNSSGMIMSYTQLNGEMKDYQVFLIGRENGEIELVQLDHIPEFTVLSTSRIHTQPILALQSIKLSGNQFLCASGTSESSFAISLINILTKEIQLIDRYSLPHAGINTIKMVNQEENCFRLLIGGWDHRIRIIDFNYQLKDHDPDIANNNNNNIIINILQSETLSFHSGSVSCLLVIPGTQLICSCATNEPPKLAVWNINQITHLMDKCNAPNPDTTSSNSNSTLQLQDSQ